MKPLESRTPEALLVVITSTEVLRVFALNLFVCEAITDTSVKLIQSFPLLLGICEMPGGLNSPPHCGGPQSHILISDRMLDQFWERIGIRQSAGRKTSITTDFPLHIEFGFAMLQNRLALSIEDE
jgi:hypothetical protein